MQMPNLTNIVEVALKELVGLDQLEQLSCQPVLRLWLNVSDAVLSGELLPGHHVQALVEVAVLVHVAVEDAARDLRRCVVH